MGWLTAQGEFHPYNTDIRLRKICLDLGVYVVCCSNYNLNRIDEAKCITRVTPLRSGVLHQD